MANPTSDPDLIAAEVVTILTGVGTLGLVTHRTPDDPYQGATPLLIVSPAQEAEGWIALRAKVGQGWIDLAYYDTPPAQQSRALALIEGDMWANRRAIVAALNANRRLNGAVTSFNDELQAQYNPAGTLVSWQGVEWVSMVLRCSYKGGKYAV